jgi:hypothetical protein
VRQLRGILGSRLIGDAFLDFHRDEGAAVWKGFGSALEALAADGWVVAGDAIAGACAVFDQIYRMLARVDMNDRAEAWTPTAH